MKAILQKLVETSGPPGHEAGVRRLIRAELEPYADEIRVDGLGNLIVRKGPLQPQGCRILIAVPMDEPGIIASHVDRNGFVRLESLGSLEPNLWAGQRVRFIDGTVGVVGFDPPGGIEQTGTLDRLYVDLGVADPSKVSIRTGDVAVFDGQYLDLGTRLAGKAITNRAEIAASIDVLRRLDSGVNSGLHQVIFAFTVQERAGGRGAGAAGFGVAPDVALALATTDGFTPGAQRGSPQLGGGPVIRVRGEALLCDPRIVDWIDQTAQHAGLNVQKEISIAASGARMLQISGDGTPAGVLALACRYAGSPVEMVDWSDATRLAELLHALLLTELPF